MILRSLFVSAIFSILSLQVFPQQCNTLNLQWQADIASTCNQMVMTMLHDANNRPYLYIAHKEAGLDVYDVSNAASPLFVANVPVLSFDTLEVMSVSQLDNYLYLALGNSFTNAQQGGMAIVDVTNPASPLLTDYYVVPNSSGGGGIVKIEGEYAYLATMESGLIIFDVSDKNNIQFLSQFVPDISFPPVPNPSPALYNARGMDVKNSIVYLCYDAGGIRIINCTNKLAPVETGRWCNPVMYTPLDHPKAYNHCILDDTLLYVAVDYAGLEVLNVSDTANITMIGWWNPNNAPNANWFTCRLHTNEMQYDKNCKRIFIADGKSDLHVVDVSNPTMPDSCNYYGGVSNSIGTWGTSLWQNYLYISYICAVIPFSSNWTGVKILSFSSCSTGINEDPLQSFNIFPNPFTSETVITTEIFMQQADISVYNSLGECIKKIRNINGYSIHLSLDDLPSGIYYCSIREGHRLLGSKKLVLSDR